MFIESIELENLRCFSKIRVNFRHPDHGKSDQAALSNVTLLLGNNGAGKSTLLRAVALASLASVIQDSGYRPFSMIRRISPSNRHSGALAKQATIRGRFRLHAQDGNGRTAPARGPVSTTVKLLSRGSNETVQIPRTKAAYWQRIFDDESPAFLVVGYGATRRVEADDSVDIAAREKSRQLRYRRVAGLFEEQVTLIPLSNWLPSLEASNKGRFSQVVTLLNTLLPSDTRFTGERIGAQYVFDRRGNRVPFGAMSDGYRQFIGWIGDLLYHVCMGCPSGKKLVDNRGIVLIDEIDMHLHPEWQRTVIPTLAQTLPNLQFILTSHSPILVGTLYRHNIVVFESDPVGATTATPVGVEVHGLNADQVLTGPSFGLTSSRAPQFVEQLTAESAKAQLGDSAAARRFHRMMVYGAGADAVAQRIETIPKEVLRASKLLNTAVNSSAAPGSARTIGRPSKKKKVLANKRGKK